MKRLLTPLSQLGEPEGLLNHLDPSFVASRKKIRLSRLSLEGRVDWILDLHVPPGGTVTCVPGSSGGDLRVEELLDAPSLITSSGSLDQTHTLHTHPGSTFQTSPNAANEVALKSEKVCNRSPSLATTDSDESGSSGAVGDSSAGGALMLDASPRLLTSASTQGGHTDESARPPINNSSSSEVLHSLTNTATTVNDSQFTDGSKLHKVSPLNNGAPSSPGSQQPAPERALIVVSSPHIPCLVKTEPTDQGDTASQLSIMSPMVPASAVMTSTSQGGRGGQRGGRLPNGGNLPASHVVKALTTATNGQNNHRPKIAMSVAPAHSKFMSAAAASTAHPQGPGVVHRPHTMSNGIKAGRPPGTMSESAPKSRVHFTANGSIPFCRMPNCGRAMYFYKNEDRWRCNLNRGGCGAVFHNVGQDIGPCSKCQRPVADGDPCYDWCVCRYCTSSKRQTLPMLHGNNQVTQLTTQVAAQVATQVASSATPISTAPATPLATSMVPSTASLNSAAIATIPTVPTMTATKVDNTTTAMHLTHPPAAVAQPTAPPSPHNDKNSESSLSFTADASSGAPPSPISSELTKV
eukprot:Blabericola_migrator_1__6655@NODE_335_length_9663_cov_193_705190_g268_i1_p3_GENE_NODE_335_length_9663_cov_193_705190_g268_i1NODE_335_length_9663_cov_193_705190_g268_i1_p3_ORF_typecomplete_len578_score54_38RecR/PF02132_15/0_0092AZUL/PF16558_5/1_1e04AZUL/PF16558_5/0_34_NODE_335_length_9663_cov_193_705190_g268_i143216054